MALLKRIVIVVLVVLLLAVVVGFLLPRRVKVERATSIATPQANVFTLVNSFRRFNEWSPWALKDPHAKYTYEGPVSGPGAKLLWVGDPATIGSGSQTIVESRPYDLVRMDLDFGPQGKADERIMLTAEGQGTRIAWSVEPDLGFNPVSRYFGLFFDRMMGPDFEQGLSRLKSLGESGPRTDVKGLEAQVTTVKSTPVAFVETTTTQDDQAIAEAIGGAFARVGVFMSANGLQQAAPPITITRQWQDGTYLFDAAIPVDRLPSEPIAADSPVKMKGTYAGLVAKGLHRGAYGGVRATYEKLLAWITLNGYQAAGDPWEEYVSDPRNTLQANMITNIYVPIK